MKVKPKRKTTRSVWIVVGRLGWPTGISDQHLPIAHAAAQTRNERKADARVEQAMSTAAELAALVEKMTPGPWDWDGMLSVQDYMERVAVIENGAAQIYGPIHDHLMDRPYNDADGIVALRNNAKRLVAALALAEQDAALDEFSIAPIPDSNSEWAAMQLKRDTILGLREIALAAYRAACEGAKP